MALLDQLKGGEAQAAPVAPKTVPSDVSAIMKDAPDNIRKPSENGFKEPTIISYISQRWTRAMMYKRPWEQLFLEAHRNYRGLFGPDTQFRMYEKSRLFIRVTKTKVNAAFGQLLDVLYADNQFPIQIDPERLPEGVIDVESIETNPQFSQFYNDSQQGQQGQQPGSPQQSSGPGYPGDGTRPGEQVAQAFTGQLRQNESEHDGPPKTPSAVEVDVALLSAKKMEKKIQDQLRMSGGDKHLRHAVFECVNLGTGCIKGPVAVTRTIEERDTDGTMKAQIVKDPAIEAVSIWNIYPDPDARSVEDCDYIIQRHKLSMSQLRGLKDRPGFRSNEIDLLISGGFNYQRQWWEPFLQDMPMVQPVEKFEVLEYWGMLDKALANDFGISEDDIPKELQHCDEVPVNIWISGHNILRLIINPFNNGRLPYYMIPYEIQPYTIWGIGVSETMADSQMLMNGFMRLAVDNAVLSGNMVFEVDESSLVPGQTYELYPGKFFRKQGGVQQNAIVAHEFPNTAAANMQLYDKARELADEATFPSYTHGNTQVNPSLGRTSSGLSMMLGAASTSIRTAIKNFDDYLLTPLGEALFEFNKLNSDDPQLEGNFIIQAGGTDSLMRNEVKSQRLISFIQLLQNPMLAPFAKWPYIIRETARLMDLDPQKATNTDEETMRMAMLLQQMQPQQQPGQGQQQNQHQPHGHGSPANPHPPGGGNPNAGQVNTPGGPGFSAAHSQPPNHNPAGHGVS